MPRPLQPLRSNASDKPSMTSNGKASNPFGSHAASLASAARISCARCTISRADGAKHANLSLVTGDGICNSSSRDSLCLPECNKPWHHSEGGPPFLVWSLIKLANTERMSRQRWSSESGSGSCTEQLRWQSHDEEDAVVERREGERNFELERRRLCRLCRHAPEEEEDAEEELRRRVTIQNSGLMPVIYPLVTIMQSTRIEPDL